ncbi:hypothetical protein JHK85_044073 [Glycine max]|nr:hypothetical protein JHK85_044073 [Glycine max]
MALKFLGGTLLSSFLQIAFEKLASPLVLDFGGRKVEETLLKKLKIKMQSIDAEADNADQKQFRDPRVRDWLLEVNDVVLDANLDQGWNKFSKNASDVGAGIGSRLSNDLDAFKVIRTIFEAITKSTDDSRNQQMVQEKLELYLKGKKFLLVLDDVWNESRKKWEAVLTPLN